MFNKRVKIKELLADDKANYQATVMGWVRTFRNNQFIALNDGSTNNNIQVVAELGKFDDALLKRLTTGACIKATGEVIPSLGKGQKVELKATDIEIIAVRAGGIVGKRYLRQMGRHDRIQRMERDAGLV